MKLYVIIPMVVLLFTGSSCKKDEGNQNNYIPDVYINRTISLNAPLYTNLNSPGGYVYLAEGHRGVIVYHSLNDQYVAFDRACTYHPDEDCAVVTMDQSGIYARCATYKDSSWVDCCGSKYQMDGTVLEGPAVYPLKSYFVKKDNNVLIITN